MKNDLSKKRTSGAGSQIPGIAILLLTAYLLVSSVYLSPWGGAADRDAVMSVGLAGSIPIGQYLLLFVIFAVFLGLLRLFPAVYPGIIPGVDAGISGALFQELLLMPAAALFAASCVYRFREVNPREDTLPLTAGVITVLGFFFYAVLKRNWTELHRIRRQMHRAGTKGRRPDRTALLLTGLWAAAGAAFYSYHTIMRYRTFSSSCFDFGIFAQMYEAMARTGLPLTTCERGTLLSHFYIHFSPAYYVFLPVYLLHRSPETLLVIQAVMVMAAAIPLFLVCRELGLGTGTAFGVSALYLVSPAIQQPLFYDFHENKFLPFFLLWLIWFFLRRNRPGTLIFLALTLSVKEDAAIHVMIMGLFFACKGSVVTPAEAEIRDRGPGMRPDDYAAAESRRQRIRGALLLAAGAVYFGLVMSFIQSHGMGLMEGHYRIYYLPGETGLFSMVRNIVLHPGYFIVNLFRRDNVPYIFYTFGALLFVPAACRDLRRLILLIPYGAIALMTTYVYQHDIGYQYTYGPMTLVFFLFALNFRRYRALTRAVVLSTCLCAGVLLCWTYRGDGYFYYARTYESHQDFFRAKEAALEEVPRDGSVTADGFMLPHLADIPELYLYEDYGAWPDTDYYVVQEGEGTQFSRNYKERGYVLLWERDGVAVYKKAPGI